MKAPYGSDLWLHRPSDIDEMMAPKPFRWSGSPLLVGLAYLLAFLAGFLGGMIAVAWALVRLLP